MQHSRIDGKEFIFTVNLEQWVTLFLMDDNYEYNTESSNVYSGIVIYGHDRTLTHEPYLMFTTPSS